MGPREDFDSTFGRVFGEEPQQSPRASPPPALRISPFAPPDRDVRSSADRENFGPGFRRSPGTGVHSPRTRTRCVQDIILRDRGGGNADPHLRYDASPRTRTSPTTAVTKTIPTLDFKENNSAGRASPKTARCIIPGLDAQLSSEEAPRTARTWGELIHGRRIAPRQRSISPGLCKPSVHLKGTQLLEDPVLDLQAAESAAVTWSPPPSPQADEGPPRFVKKRFPERRDFGGGTTIQQPGVDGGEHADAVTIGEVSVPDNLSLRPEHVDLNKKISQRRTATGSTVNEWQYRTREIVTMRSKERGKVRWR